MPNLPPYYEARTIRLDHAEVLPGTSTHFTYNVGSMPTGTRVAIHMEIFRSENPGPHVLVIGGVHGD